MVKEELKRVSAEKDALKKKADEWEKEIAALQEKVTTFKAAQTENEASTEAPKGARGREPSESTEDKQSGSMQSPTPPAAKSPVQRVLSVFSPTQKPQDGEGSGVRRSGDDFFSFENEMPQLQAEVKSQSDEIRKLQTEVGNLKEELSLAKEHSADLVEKLENTARELSELRDMAAVKQSIETQLEARNNTIASLTERLGKAQKQLKDLEAQVEKERSAATAAGKEQATMLKASAARVSELEAAVESAAEAKAALDKRIASIRAEMDSLKKAKAEDEARIRELVQNKTQSTPTSTPAAAATQQPAGSGGAATGKKGKKKKKKGSPGVAASAAESVAGEAGEAGAEQSAITPTAVSDDGQLAAELARLREEIIDRDEQIENLSKQRKANEDLREEVENLRENLMTIGQEHVEARQKIKILEGEKDKLLSRIAELEKEMESSANVVRGHSTTQAEYESLKQEFDDLQSKSTMLRSDLAAAQQLAQSRYKDLSNMREALQKASPELKSLRQESAMLKSTREELAARSNELRTLEKREKELKSDVARAHRITVDREAEIKCLQEKLSQEMSARARMEDEKRVAGRDLRRSEVEKIELSAKEEKMGRELQRVQDEAAVLRPRVAELEAEVAKLRREAESRNESAELRASQYANAQSLLASMRDQTAELSVQLRESQAAGEALDEELIETRRMLGERTREAETMRRLLADVDERNDAKVRDMKARMEAAMEERDRVEDEASTLARRRARETEELRSRVRDLEREVKGLTAEKDRLEQAEREWRRRREESEGHERRATAEVDEMRTTVANLRSTLDASEQQERETEKQRAELRRTLDDMRERYEKLLKDYRNAQARLAPASNQAVSASSRSSMDSTRSTARSSMQNGTGAKGAGSAAPVSGGASSDAMYLKTILLQFLETKDNKLKAQLVPVLGKLLKFDKCVAHTPPRCC